MLKLSCTCAEELAHKKGRQQAKTSSKNQMQLQEELQNRNILEKSHLDVADILYFLAAWCIFSYPRQRKIQNEIRCSTRTVVDWSSFVREVCVNWTVSNSCRLGGPGVVFEIDEAKFGKRKYNRGRRIEGQWVFGGFDRTTKEIFWYPYLVVMRRHFKI